QMVNYAVVPASHNPAAREPSGSLLGNIAQVLNLVYDKAKATCPSGIPGSNENRVRNTVF
ncbi:hypothetical protein HY496_00950, partial [Candidatus Woesearchaeota archaeon]|nr:hypothetical protein [Candidatus Woesearchaeota archaeon]